LIENGQSFVTFGRPWGIDDMNDPQHLWVDVDGRHGLREATTHLLKTGLRRIGYIGWPSPSGTGDDRRLGWLETMRESSGLTAAEIAELEVTTQEGVSFGVAAVRALESVPSGVEGVVCASDSLALGALIGSTRRIPIIGYDNTPVAASIGFSSVEQPLDEVATGVLDLLTGAHGGKLSDDAVTDPRHRLVKPRLIVRDVPTLGVATR
jgi:DNA-binding LacI/PurR family transcriptional regulator